MAHLDIEGAFTSSEPPRQGSASTAAGTSRETARKSRTWTFRARDILFVLAALPLVLPVLLAIALIIKLDDPTAPIFFRQQRTGRFGKTFSVLKFRTMVPGAEEMKAQLLALSEDKGAGFKLDDDPRVTAPGRILRALYLDELPQLWNVLVGDMSLVGPRPNSFPVDTYEPWQRERLDVRPGLTGSWQVMHPKPRDFETRCRIDVDYVRNQSFPGDVMILVRTALVCVLRRTGC